MKKIVTLVLILIMVLIAGFAFKDTVEVETTITEHYVPPSEDVINQFGQLLVTGFEWLSDDVKWLDEQHIQFQGRRGEAEKAHYKLDTDTLELVEVDFEDDSRACLYKGNLIRLYKNKSNDDLYIYEDGEESLLASAENYDSSSLLMVSDNEDKVGYYNPTKAVVEAYDISNHKLTKLHYGNEDGDQAFDSSFSPDGGFVSFAHPMPEISESHFSVLGADSGRYYGKEIKGVEPTFSPNSKTLAFIYSGEMNNEYVGAKLGLFILKYKKIIYLDTLMQGEKILPMLAWSQDSSYIYAITQTADGRHMFNIFDVTTGSRTSMVFQGVDSDVIREILVTDQMAYLVFDKGLMCGMNIDDGRYNLTKGLLKFENSTHFKKLKSGNILIFTAEELHLLTPIGYRLISDYDASVKGIYLSPEESSVGLLLDNGEEMQLKIANID